MTTRFLPLLLIIAVLITKASAKQWYIYEHCELAEEGVFDGDRFSVKAGTGYTYVFHLYGVDCPEADDGAKTRLEEQTKEFDCEQADVIKWGEEASRFVRNFLSQPFIVFTQKIKAPGGKSQYYAMVINADGERLDEALIAAGLARCQGTGAEWDEPFWGKLKADLPRRITSKRFIRKLHAMESKAKRERVGVWER